MIEGIECFYCNAFVPGTSLSCPVYEEGDVSGWKATKSKYFDSNKKWCRIIIITGDHLISTGVIHNGAIVDQVSYIFLIEILLF